MKKIFALALVCGAIALVGGLPNAILQRTSRYQVVSPQVLSYRTSVRCEGTVYPKEGYELLVSGTYEVKERFAALGDMVAKGQTLAVLEPVGETPILYLQTQGSGVSGMAQSNDLAAAFAESYGLSAALTSENGYEALQKMVEEQDAEDGPILVTAPVSGAITKEIPVPGSIVKAGSALCSVEGREEFFALLSIGEKDAAKVSAGNEVLLSGEGVGGVSCRGIVSRVYPGTRRELSGTTAQNIVDLEVAIEGGEQEIRPGFSVKAKIYTDEEREVLALPYESIRQGDNNQEYVLVAGAYRLEKRPISTGVEMIDGVEILEGIGPNDLVTIPQENAADEPERFLLVRG